MQRFGFSKLESAESWLVHVLVFSEKVVEHSESRFQVQVDNVFWSSFGPGKSSILHEFEGQSDIGDLLRK